MQAYAYQNVERVATYSYWKQYEKKRKARKRAELFRKIVGAVLFLLGFSIPFLLSYKFMEIAQIMVWVLTACVFVGVMFFLIASGLIIFFEK